MRSAVVLRQAQDDVGVRGVRGVRSSTWRRPETLVSGARIRTRGRRIADGANADGPAACAAGVSAERGAGRLAAGPYLSRRPGRIGPDAPLSRWKLLDRSDHHSSGCTDFNRGTPCATSGGSIATGLRSTPLRTGVRVVSHGRPSRGQVLCGLMHLPVSREALRSRGLSASARPSTP